MRASPDFGALVDKIWAELRDEVVRATAETGAPTTRRRGMRPRAPRWLAEPASASSRRSSCCVAWEAASAAGLLRAAFFPRPTAILGHALDLAADGTLGATPGVTLARVAGAFALAAVPGVAIGLAMGVSRRLRDGLDPLFAVIYPIPSVLFLPLFSFVLRPARPR